MIYKSKFTGAEIDSLLGKVERGEVGIKITVDSALSTTSENPVMNKVITEELNKKATPMKSVTYAELVTLRDNKELSCGRVYRITDYITTTMQDKTQSAGHPFDVIVLALSESELSEQAWAIHSARDTDGYFANSKLSAWKIWYSLDNDTDRFVWADTANGKGVIYRMIDEFGNDCPYDFKNIKFKHPKDTKTYPDYYYTFTVILSEVVNDCSLDGIYCYGNTMGRYVDREKQMVNGNVFINTQKNPCHSNTFGNNCRLNAFGDGCYSNTFGNNCRNNSFGFSCYSNNFGYDCFSNTFGYGCYSNTFDDNCYSNTFGNNCRLNAFGFSCNSNTFGVGGYCNSFGNNCFNNSFGNNCSSNSFGNSCYSNNFGYDYCDNTFGNGCYSNTFGNNCRNNSFGNSCYSNNFGDTCNNNSFSDSCYSNDFGNNCQNNSFGNKCYKNRFGNGSYGNSFKNNCHDNSLGVGCGYNSFGDSCKFNSFGESTDNIKSYYRYIIFDNGNSYINLNCTTTTSTSNYYQNVRIGLGVNNKSTYKTITDSNVGQTYETLYKPANSKELTA